jgi:hypothetical protein
VLRARLAEARQVLRHGKVAGHAELLAAAAAHAGALLALFVFATSAVALPMPKLIMVMPSAFADFMGRPSPITSTLCHSAKVFT